MTDKDTLSRLDALIVRMDERLARLEEHDARWAGRLARLEEHDARWDERAARLEAHDARMDERLVRLDRLVAGGQETLAAINRSFDLMARAFERLVRADAKRDDRMREMSEQIAANTQAVLRMIDRLGPAPG